jgi:hypothetical protein
MPTPMLVPQIPLRFHMTSTQVPASLVGLAGSPTSPHGGKTPDHSKACGLTTSVGGLTTPLVV